MKAAVLERRGAEGLIVRQAPMPKRRPGEALMRVRAASLNRVDLYLRDDGRGITHELPMVLGVDGAGEIVEADAESGLTPGMKAVLYPAGFCGSCRYCLSGDQPLCTSVRYAGEHRDGTFAEYVAMPASCFLPLPDDTDLQEVATLPVAYLTAWRMLFGKRALGPGETLVVTGIGGGVATACLQLGLIAGARVIVTSRRTEALRHAEALGAHAAIDTSKQKLARGVLDLTGGEGADMVIDSIGGEVWSEALKALRRGGRIVTCGATAGDNPPADLRRVFIRQLEIHGSTLGSIEEFRRLLAVYRSGRLKPAIDRTYPLEEIGDAFARLQGGEQIGKIAIRID